MVGAVTAMFIESMEKAADIFRSDYYMQVLSECVSIYRPYMPDFFKRYQGDMSIWDSDYRMINAFFDTRYDYIVPIVTR